MSSSEFPGLDYKLEEAMWTLMLQREVKPLYDAFAKHLQLVREALEAIDCVLDGGQSDGYEDAAIRAVLGENWQGKTVEAALERIEQIRDELLNANSKITP